MEVFAEFSPEVEAISLDEAFHDMTGLEQLFGDPGSMGRRLKEVVREATGDLTASVGLSATKYVAKVAKGMPAGSCNRPGNSTSRFHYILHRGEKDRDNAHCLGCYRLEGHVCQPTTPT